MLIFKFWLLAMCIELQRDFAIGKDLMLTLIAVYTRICGSVQYVCH